MSRKESESAEKVETNMVLSQRIGDVIYPGGVLKMNDCVELPCEVAQELVKAFPEIRIVK
jgi:hypothetical protein